MNDTTKECNGKNANTNQVCHTLRLRGSWDLVTLTSRVGEGMGGGERGEKQKKYFLGGCPIREVFLRERLPQCKTSKIFTCHDETVTLTFNLT